METQLFFKKLIISNFKGTKELEINLGMDTVISGANETGKTTIYDAILWALFGKNSQNAKDFNIKNTVFTELNRSDHSVELIIDNNGDNVSLKRVFKEKWTKRRGSEDLEFTGHETLFFWNDVPLLSGAYQAKVSDMIQEDLFRQLTDPLYVTTKMSEKDVREMLIRMGGELSDEKIINGTPAFQFLLSEINAKKTLDELSKEIAAKKTGIKKQLADIPPRIAELLRSNPEQLDWQAIEAEIIQKQKNIKEIEKEIEDVNASYEKEMAGVRVKQQEAIAASRKMGETENELTKKAYAEAAEANKSISEERYLLGELRRELKSSIAQEAEYTAKKVKLESEIQKLREAFTEENARQFIFDRDACVCPTCKRAFESATVEQKETELYSSFREDQALNIASIRAKGKKLAEDIKQIEFILEGVTTSVITYKEREQKFIWAETAVPAQPKPVDLSKNVQYQNLKAISEAKIETKPVDVSELREVKLSLTEAIEELKNMLVGKAQIEKNAIRIDQLKAEESNYSHELAGLEKQEFAIAEFNKTKMSLVEQSINSRFKTVKWIMFDKQINGGERPCCIPTVKGVPFKDVNHADQIKAGLDIINAISEYYGVLAPVVVDNAESVQNIKNGNSQMIRLYVTKDPKIVISHE